MISILGFIKSHRLASTIVTGGLLIAGCTGITIATLEVPTPDPLPSQIINDAPQSVVTDQPQQEIIEDVEEGSDVVEEVPNQTPTTVLIPTEVAKPADAAAKEAAAQLETCENLWQDNYQRVRFHKSYAEWEEMSDEEKRPYMDADQGGDYINYMLQKSRDNYFSAGCVEVLGHRPL